jgi:hypothetical protein
LDRFGDEVFVRVARSGCIVVMSHGVRLKRWCVGLGVRQNKTKVEYPALPFSPQQYSLHGF